MGEVIFSLIVLILLVVVLVILLVIGLNKWFGIMDKAQEGQVTSVSLIIQEKCGVFAFVYALPRIPSAKLLYVISSLQERGIYAQDMNRCLILRFNSKELVPSVGEVITVELQHE